MMWMGVGVGRSIAILMVGVLVVTGVAGCGRDKSVCDQIAAIPGGIELESGDILLARCSGFLPAVFAGLGEPGCDYGHAGVFFRDSGGCGRILHMQPSGIAVYTPGEFWEKYFKVGLVRSSVAGSLDGMSFDRECRKLLEYDKSHRILSDFWDENGMENTAGEYPDSIYCLSLINMLYSRSGAEEPFVVRCDIGQYPVVRFIGEALDRKEYSIPVVASIYQNVSFRLMGEYVLSKDKLKCMIIDNAIVKTVNSLMNEGYVPKSPPLLKRPVVAALYGIKILLTPFLPAGTKAMVEKIDSYNELSELYVFNRYIKEVRSESMESAGAKTDGELYSGTVELAEKVSRKYFALTGE